MVSPPDPSHQPHHQNHTFSMANSKYRAGRAFPCFADGCLFLAGVFMALLFVWSFSGFVLPTPSTDQNLGRPKIEAGGSVKDVEGRCPPPAHVADSSVDPPERTFYDDPSFGYVMEKPVKGWDEKRKEWLRLHPSFDDGRERVLLVTGSQAAPCRNKIGDHLLLRFFKNKVDYCRRHGCDVFYNNVLLQPKMFTYWAKYPAVKAAMLAHPEAEWIWWVDADALFTDMDFALPLARYRDHNLVVHGWAHLVHDKKSWTSINAGIFLIRNCQWSLDFMDEWAGTGPQSPDYERWGKVLSSTFKDKIFPESDDQAALIYLILNHPDDYGKKIYIENEYYFQGYWVEIVPNLDNITKRYMDIEKGEGDNARILRRRHAEKVSDFYAGQWETQLKDAGNGLGSWRRPFITHFTGCQPCSGDHNQMYSGESCWNGMIKALTFADNQVLRNYGFLHRDLMDSETVDPVPFDFPATRPGIAG